MFKATCLRSGRRGVVCCHVRVPRSTLQMGEEMSDCLAGNRRSRDKHNQNIMLIALIALIVLIALDVMGAGVSGIQAVAFFFWPF